MDITLALRQMCQDILTDTDIRAIGKNRGFAAGEIANRVTLENFWLSSLGLEQAMAGLSATELTLLYALKMHKKPVTIAFFGRLFEDKAILSNTYETFSQKYQPVFKAVNTSFVRRGILLIFLDPDLEQIKMGRWRFYFPELFWSALPPLFPNALADTRPGQTNNDFADQFVANLINVSQSASSVWQIDPAGNLLGNGQPFTVAQFQQVQSTTLDASVHWVAHNDQDEKDFTPANVMQDIFGYLPAGYWLSQADINSALNVYLNRKVPGEKFCESGKQVAYLSELEIGQARYYRPADNSADKEPTSYLTPLNKTTLAINIAQIPLVNLEKLNQWMRFSLQDKKQLTISPSLGKMGLMPLHQLQTDPLALWLSDHLPSFKKNIQQIKQQWGRQIVHDNLLVARVKDLSLRIRLERSFADKGLMVLADEYLAFPPALLPQVTKVVTTAGHIVKNYG